MEEDIQFEFNYPNIDFTQRVDREVDPNAPDLFSYSQSPYQAFYWISNADIDGEPLEVGVDWIGAFYGDECIGIYSEYNKRYFENTPDTLSIGMNFSFIGPVPQSFLDYLILEPLNFSE